MTVKRITYREISRRRRGYNDGGESPYARHLRMRFGGKGVPLTDEVADFCSNKQWCVAGAVRTLIRNRKDREQFQRRSDWKLNEKLCVAGVGYWERNRRRWRNLFRYVNRKHAAKQRAALKEAA